MNEYIKHLKQNNYSINTINTYKSILKQYDKFKNIRDIKLKILSYKDVPNTAWTHYNVICSFLTFKNDRRIQMLKELKLPPIPQKYNVVFTKKYLLRKTENLSDEKCVIIRFLFETGLRASELKQIIAIKKNTLVVMGKGNKIREVFHNNETTKLFKEFKYSTKTLRLWVKEILGENYTPHSIRRSHATHMLVAGANPKAVMLQLGHSKIETTYRYLNMSIEMNKKIYNKYF